MLLLAGALIGELPHDILAETGRFRQHIIQPVKDLPEVVGVQGELLVVWSHFVT
jgi:hypothetical protein